MGVSQMELVNKFDNALAGVAGDEGSDRRRWSTPPTSSRPARFWRHATLPDRRPAEVHDKDQDGRPATPNPFTAAGRAVRRDRAGRPASPLPVALPVYGAKPHCNDRGLTDLGDYTIRGMAKRHMIFDPDHMSVTARKASLDLLESMSYPGVVSSHSWSTPDAYPRIYRLGGFITPYAGDSTGFVEKWKQHLTWADPRYYWGFGYGADINGLGAQGDPRGRRRSNPVTYPFTGLGGVTSNQQVSGQRVYDINKDGVAHYGLYPDWLQDLRKVAGRRRRHRRRTCPAARRPTCRCGSGPTASANDGCRDPRALRSADLRCAASRPARAPTYVLTARGPAATGGSTDTFTYCGRTSTGGTTTVTVQLRGRRDGWPGSPDAVAGVHAKLPAGRIMSHRPVELPRTEPRIPVVCRADAPDAVRRRCRQIGVTSVTLVLVLGLADERGGPADRRPRGSGSSTG